MLDVTYLDRAVSLPGGTLVVADLHVGQAEAARVEASLGEERDLTTRLGARIDEAEPDTVVFAGDVVHQFGHVSAGARETLSALADVCADAGAGLVVVEGNHDTTLADVWDGPVVDHYRVDSPLGEVVVCHGHETVDDALAPALYVVGHDHPAITIEGRKRPCFLYGVDGFGDADVLMLPAFSRVASGVVVNRMRSRDFQSPFVSDVDAFRPVVFDDDSGEALSFPPLGRFRRLL